jgi:hypothetical protein
MSFRAIGVLVVVALAQGQTSNLALLEAARTGDLVKLRSFLGIPALVNARGPNGRTALHEAADACRIEAVRLLIANGWDRLAPDNNGVTPAMLLRHCQEDARVLLTPLTVPAIPREDSPMSMHYAAAHRQTSVVEMFLKLGMNADTPGSQGNRALDLACRNGDVATAALLLDHGANPNLRDKSGTTPLHDAALNGNREVIEILLKHGAEIDALDADDKSTPLDYAASMDRADAVKALIARGANTKLRNAAGLTARDIALKNNFTDVADFLSSPERNPQ